MGDLTPRPPWRPLTPRGASASGKGPSKKAAKQEAAKAAWEVPGPRSPNLDAVDAGGRVAATEPPPNPASPAAHGAGGSGAAAASREISYSSRHFVFRITFPSFFLFLILYDWSALPGSQRATFKNCSGSSKPNTWRSKKHLRTVVLSASKYSWCRPSLRASPCCRGTDYYLGPS
ncbi:hypothetical protein NDU88_003678 [Pleurodeles waltl]|uniref:Uncharacterized protein n=1 Tax=Pleurodeles waltl TaxID=8319 RepID=A0AAV7TPD4_PLEWA|nr:hypothetical protein NDU88_003678 [Pleurodeles waltl]